MRSERVIPEMVATIAVSGAAEWLALSDDLLAGLVHALNNRVTALSVCAELASMGDEQMLGDGVLVGEVSRLQRVGALVGLLPARSHVPEALEVAPVLQDAIALHSHHPRVRAIECVIEREGATQPVRAPRWALLRLLLFFVDAAKTGAQDARHGAVTVRLSSDEQSVRVRAIAREIEGAYAAEMATLCDGTLAREGEELVVTLPSLPELRRRERMGQMPGGSG
jgi:hypothetical protein